MRAIESVSHVTIADDDPATAAANYAALLNVAPDEAADDTGSPTYRFETGNIAVWLRKPRARDAAGLCGLTFRVSDLARACETLARCGVPAADRGTKEGGAILDRGGTHGLPIALTCAPAPTGRSAPVSLDHVVIRTPHPERAVALYGGRLGLDMRLDRTNPAWGARLMFFRCGDLVVEVVHALSREVSDASDTFGGLSWRVPDIDAAHARLLAAGFDLSPVRAGRRAGSRVCTVRNRTVGVPTILLGLSPREPVAD